MRNITVSNEARIVLGETVVGRWLRKSVLSLIKLLTCLVIGFKMISIRLLSLCVSFVGPATIGLKFISSFSEISI